jgi:hypothetical protein
MKIFVKKKNAFYEWAFSQKGGMERIVHPTYWRLPLLPKTKFEVGAASG